MPVMFRVAGIVAVLAQQGCATPASMNPVDWWHDLEGGPIAETRPPPPNADAPYPNLASVPARPNPGDQALRARVASRLLSDRASAQYAAATVPLAAPLPATARPATAAAAPADQSDALGARLQAASAPPPAAPPPVTAATPAATAVASPMPAIPANPPAVPVLTGVGVPAITAPTPPLPAPPAVTPPVSIIGTTVAVPFTAGSAALPPTGQTALRQLALHRGTAVIAVTGFGEAGSSDPPAQSAALPLAWARAQAIAGTLRAAGVPANRLRLTAEATGRGGVAAIAD